MAAAAKEAGADVHRVGTAANMGFQCLTDAAWLSLLGLVKFLQAIHLVGRTLQNFSILRITTQRGERVVNGVVINRLDDFAHHGRYGRQ